MLKRSSIAGMPLLILWDFNLYKDNPKKDIKEKREDSMTHIFRRQSRLSQCLCISLKVLDTLKNLTKDTHEVYSNINNLNLVMVFLDRHCYCTQCHITRAPARPTGMYYMHHRAIDFFPSPVGMHGLPPLQGCWHMFL